MTAREAGAALRVERLVKQFGRVGEPALDGLSLHCDAGEVLVVVGASGCGKTTLLRCIAGLERPTAGRVLIGGRDVTDAEPHARGVAMVFQHYGLYPDKTVEGNIAFPLRMAGVGREERQRRVRAVAELVRVGHLLERRPAELSGGQKQRVGIARALARGPELLLMDEPLSSLDAQLRVEMRAELASLQRRLGTTVVYVTHDQVEAMSLADRLAVLDAGRLAQIGRPQDVFDRPASTFVAGFLGAMNLVTGIATEGRLRTDSGGVIELPPGSVGGPPRPLVVGIRPEHLHLGGTSVAVNGTAAAKVVGRCRLVELLGTEKLVHLDVGGATLRARVPAGVALGERVELVARAEHLHVFDPHDGRRLDAATSAPGSRLTTSGRMR